ncbi:hypothetical protein GCM10022407_33480 [Hymenobacter antarcticus]|uniref:DUF551 domain-containing protein n=1 Tax=Hymenobacter antarcticus TaxID=486270 RepID=A0ABP7QPT9_9BACT
MRVEIEPFYLDFEGLICKIDPHWPDFELMWVKIEPSYLDFEGLTLEIEPTWVEIEGLTLDFHFLQEPVSSVSVAVWSGPPSRPLVWLALP